jgi:uncharacterized protein (TIGR03437 family)
MPTGTANGAATVMITSGNGAISGGVVRIAAVAPGILTANSSGRGVAAANALTYRPDGTSFSQKVSIFDPATNQFVASPIDLGAEGNRTFLILYGTGAQHRSSLEAVKVIIDGIDAPVSYAGPQGGYAGLDQFNIELPRKLAGRGLVDVFLIVDGVIANVVQIHIR